MEMGTSRVFRGDHASDGYMPSEMRVELEISGSENKLYHWKALITDIKKVVCDAWW